MDRLHHDAPAPPRPGIRSSEGIPDVGKEWYGLQGDGDLEDRDGGHELQSGRHSTCS